MMGRLKEKVENSKRNGFPFSILLISLIAFKTKNNLPAYEMDTLLRSVVDCLKEDIRTGVDIAARMDEYGFIIAMPGSPLKKAEEIAVRFKNTISERVKAPNGLLVEVTTGVAEYSINAEKLSTTLEVDKLISIATENSC